jgi:hypothetical protein
MQVRSAPAPRAAERFDFAAVLMLLVAAVGASCVRDVQSMARYTVIVTSARLSRVLTSNCFTARAKRRRLL